MVLVAAVLAASQGWSVEPFVDRFRGNRALGEATAHALERSLRTQAFTSGGQHLVQPYGRKGVSVRGEIIEYRLLKSGKDKTASVIIRTLVVDAQTGIAVDGALTIGESPEILNRSPSLELFTKAAEQAAGLASLVLRRMLYPEARILATTSYAATVDRGGEDGFGPQARIVLLHGDHAVAYGTVASSRPGRAEIAFDGSVVGLEPGDHAQVVEIPPESFIEEFFPEFSSGCTRPPHRIHWIWP